LAERKKKPKIKLPPRPRDRNATTFPTWKLFIIPTGFIIAVNGSQNPYNIWRESREGFDPFFSLFSQKEP
jgi:hypothetical protein